MGTEFNDSLYPLKRVAMFESLRKNLKVTKRDEFYLGIRTEYDFPSLNDAIDKAVKYYREAAVNLYFRPMMTFDVPDSFFRPHIEQIDIENDLKKMGIQVRKLVKKAELPPIESSVRTFSDSLVFRVRSSEITMYIEIFGHQNVAENINDIRIPISIYMFDNVSEALYMYTMSYDENNRWHYNDSPVGPFIVSNYSFKNKSNDFALMITDDMINIFSNSLVMYRKNYTNDPSQFSSSEYTELEINIFQKMRKNSQVFNDSPFNIHTWRNDGCNITANNKMSRFISDSKVSAWIKNYNTNCPPLVDFNVKEWKYIEKYVSNIFGDSPSPINLYDALENPRYGNTVLVPVKMTSGETINVTVIVRNLDYNGEEDDITFSSITIKYQIGPNIIFSDIYIFDSENFTGNNISILRTDVFIGDKLFSSTDEPSRIFPELFFDKDYLFRVAIDIIGLFVVLHDRPKRSRVVREIKNNTATEKNRKKYKDPFVVKRILMTDTAAKEYVKKMTLSERRDAEYVLEEWPRKGYTKKMKKSGKIVEVKSTTCHRRLPLSDKEIHIKL